MPRSFSLLAIAAIALVGFSCAAPVDYTSNAISAGVESTTGLVSLQKRHGKHHKKHHKKHDDDDDSEDDDDESDNDDDDNDDDDDDDDDSGDDDDNDDDEDDDDSGDEDDDDSGDEDDDDSGDNDDDDDDSGDNGDSNDDDDSADSEDSGDNDDDESSGDDDSSSSETTSKSSSKSSSKESSSGSGKSYSGTATFFHPATEGGSDGACGPSEGDNDPIVALNAPQYGDMSEKSSWCGKKISIKGPAGTATATVNDACPECKSGDLDLTPMLFKKIVGDLDKGVGDITWSLA